MKPRDMISKGIMQMMSESPFYTTIILRHTVEEVEGLNSAMCTDGKTLRYDPDMIKEIQIDEIREILKHEACHVAYAHHIRMAQLEPVYKKRCEEAGVSFFYMCNVAADLAINWVLMQNSELWTSGKFLKKCLLPGREEYSELDEGKTMEWYFKELMKRIEDMPKQNAGGESGGGKGDKDSVQGIGSIMPAEGDLQEVQNELGQTLAQAANASRMAGTESGSAKNFLKEFEAPAKLNWRTELQNFFTQTTKGRPNFQRPNRRYHSKDIIFPNRKVREVSSIALVVDMSGSMKDECVSSAYDHISDIIKVSNSTRIVLVPFDTKVFEDDVRIYDSSNVPIAENKRKRCGYGGTMFVPALKYAEELNPAGIILLTDLLPSDCSAFRQYQSKMPLLILSVLAHQFGKEYARQVSEREVPKNARVIEIEP
jgi:predicted metal-dependent peptidase